MLDLSGIYASYERRTAAAGGYLPEMMLRLLLYGYCVGVYSSRKIELRPTKICFSFLSADQHPDHDTIANFRKRIWKRLRVCLRKRCCCARRRAWSSWARAIDGSKIKANASKHKSMSYDRMARPSSV